MGITTVPDVKCRVRWGTKVAYDGRRSEGHGERADDLKRPVSSEAIYRGDGVAGKPVISAYGHSHYVWTSCRPSGVGSNRSEGEVLPEE